MKLRNKETGEIVEVELPITNGDGWSVSASSLAELNKDWEDYKEPKKLYILDGRQSSCSGIITREDESDWYDNMVELGLGFETYWEAEKAVEKLKAWKRLKDKGFKFDGWDENHHNLGIIEFSFNKVENNVWDFEKDLDLLFGGEE